jgi:hypothetical protein
VLLYFFFFFGWKPFGLDSLFASLPQINQIRQPKVIPQTGLLKEFGESRNFYLESPQIQPTNKSSFRTAVKEINLLETGNLEKGVN